MEFTDQFGQWWDTLGVSEQQSVDAAVRVLASTVDKRGRWQEFYAETIPFADRLYDEHLTELDKEQRK